MLLTGVNGDLKNAAKASEIMQLLNGKAAKESVIHQAIVAPQFFVGSAGSPPATSYLACIAVKCAFMQSRYAGEKFYNMHVKLLC